MSGVTKSIASSTAGERIVSLQILRFAAATSVIALHVSQVLGSSDPKRLGTIGEFGPGGVDIFFVLSGFIITSSSAGKKPIDFLARRFARIVPLYWCLTAIMMILHFAAGVFDPRRMLASFLFLPTLGYAPYILSGWTLCFEMLFYICFALTLLSPKRLIPFMLALYLAAAIGRDFFAGPMLQFVGNPLILEFFCGCLIAILPRSRLFAWLSAAGAIAWGITILISGNEASAYQAAHSADGLWLRLFMWGTPAFLLIYFAAQIRLIGRIWIFLSYLGDASYSAYLVHDFILIPLVFIRSAAPGGAVFLSIVFCWCIAVLVHEYLEKPLLRLFRPAKAAPTREFLVA